MSPTPGAQITGGPNSAKVGESVTVTSHHTARVTNTTDSAVDCKITYRISHDRGNEEFLEETTRTLEPNDSLSESADGVLGFAPSMTGPYRLKAETKMECGALGSKTASSTNWAIQVSQ